MIIHGRNNRLGKNCNRCGKRFVPRGKYHRICETCSRLYYPKYSENRIKIYDKGKKDGIKQEKKRIVEIMHKGLSDWFGKWNREIVNGRCLVDLKEIILEIEK